MVHAQRDPLGRTQVVESKITVVIPEFGAMRSAKARCRVRLSTRGAM
jgi:hypothetical protein